MAENGLTTFAMHADDAAVGPTITGIAEEITRTDHDRQVAVDFATLDPETAARRYLAQMIESPAVPGLTAETGDTVPEYRTIGTETQPLTRTTTVKFAQYLHRIPVYGSLVTIELGEANELVSISSALGDPTGVDPMATVAPADAYAVIRAYAGGDRAPTEDLPRLYYYFDDRPDPARWRLVYIAKRVQRALPDDEDALAPAVADCVVDAHDRTLVATLPRTRTVGPQPEKWVPTSQSAVDALGRQQTVRAQHNLDTDVMRLSDTVRNIRTHDFAFQDIARFPGRLPGTFVANPPAPWNPAAISAHVHATAVAEFLLTILFRDSLDGAGGPIISSINCTFRKTAPNQREWRNAAWFVGQMVYGQRLVQGRLQSYAVAKDVVAHEIIHGLTENTADLVYERESGALNESYSDLLGIIIANADEPDIGQWDWEMGEDLDATGQPLRDISDPTRTNDPAHMDDFQVLPSVVEPQQGNDFGFVHTNSGIHNKAGFNLITAHHPDGSLVFTPVEAAALFFLCLTRRLSRTSGFSDSRRGIEIEAQSLFRSNPPAERIAKLAAIADAFDAVGISAN